MFACRPILGEAAELKGGLFLCAAVGKLRRPG
jgi:hypothetical protein